MIFDAHLDLAYNALRGRDVTRPARQQPPDDEGIPTVGLPDLRDGGVRRICATIFCEPSIGGKPGYRNPDEAHAAALRQLDWYDQQRAAGRLVPATAGHAALPGDAIATTILLEGADPIRSPGEVGLFHTRGVRIVGLAWKRTRYAGGTGAPGGLTPEGVELVRELDRFGIIHDASHLAEASFWQLLDLARGRVIASHSNCRAIVGQDPGERHLSDEMIRALIARGAVIGINFFDRFLLPHTEYKQRRATLNDVVRHAQHICDLAGNANHVGLGTDMDGGLGRNEIPEEIETSADLPKVGQALRAAGFAEADVRRILHDNWADALAVSA
jgi:membrane dipeptidase